MFENLTRMRGKSYSFWPIVAGTYRILFFATLLYLFDPTAVFEKQIDHVQMGVVDAESSIGNEAGGILSFVSANSLIVIVYVGMLCGLVGLFPLVSTVICFLALSSIGLLVASESSLLTLLVLWMIAGAFLNIPADEGPSLNALFKILRRAKTGGHLNAISNPTSLSEFELRIRFAVWIVGILTLCMLFFMFPEKPYNSFDPTTWNTMLDGKLWSVSDQILEIVILIALTPIMMLVLIRYRADKIYKRPLYVLVDGNCGMCKKTAAVLQITDFFQKVMCCNAHDREFLEAQGLANLPPQEVLMTDMHVVRFDKTKDGEAEHRMWRGYESYQVICQRIPLFWPLVPILYLPPVAAIGRMVYRRVADTRTCALPAKPKAEAQQQAAKSEQRSVVDQLKVWGPPVVWLVGILYLLPV
jgi:predicted DCC family thiol-disulfide oxidoreductase YuxK